MEYHVGLIPDGNRRWARARNLDPWEGHRVGADKAESFIEWCIDHDEIWEISVYALSEENFGRPQGELRKLFTLYEEKLMEIRQRKKIEQARLRINLVCTKQDPIPKGLMRLARDLSHKTAHYDGKVLNMLLGYTGQSEILDSVSSPRNRIRNLLFGLREEDLVRGLQVTSPCDLIIRTGDEEHGREAKSGFLLWQSAYSEYYHIDKLFPDVTVDDFDAAWAYFIRTVRNRGL